LVIVWADAQSLVFLGLDNLADHLLAVGRIVQRGRDSLGRLHGGPGACGLAHAGVVTFRGAQEHAGYFLEAVLQQAHAVTLGL
jgi:hypothetical protein